jgi:hypothetical protein
LVDLNIEQLKTRHRMGGHDICDRDAGAEGIAQGGRENMQGPGQTRRRADPMRRELVKNCRRLIICSAVKLVTTLPQFVADPPAAS